MPQETIQQPTKELVLPAPHYLARMIRANETYVLGGRGTFKTSRGIALYVVDMVYEMPGSTGVCVGLSFEHIGDNTLPPLLQALEEFGLHHGEHYIVGKKPPKDWPKPYLGVINDKYDHVISFHNGTIVYLVSLAKKASANGISAQWGFFDEVKFMDEKELTDEIFPIFRGNKETKQRFEHCSGYLSKLFATDKKADPVKIKWLLNKRKLQNPKRAQAVIALQLQVTAWEEELMQPDTTKKRAKELEALIKKDRLRLTVLRKELVYVAEVSAYDVLYAHGEKWLKDKERNSTKHDFKVIYKNEDPDKPGDSFYPDFDESKHTYESDYDIDPVKPFIIAPDYQHSVSPISVVQLAKLPKHEKVSLNYVDEVYTLGNPSEEPAPNGNGREGGLEAAVQLLCDRYATHLNKTVYYIYDQTATGKRNDADRYKDIVVNTLKRNGWRVVEVYTGAAPLHFLKYTDTQAWLQGTDASAYPIKINRKRCPKLIISITGAPAKTKNGKTEKDKSMEQEATLDQSETTHFSDTFDMINDAVNKKKRISATTESRRAGSR